MILGVVHLSDFQWYSNIGYPSNVMFFLNGWNMVRLWWHLANMNKIHMRVDLISSLVCGCPSMALEWVFSNVFWYTKLSNMASGLYVGKGVYCVPLFMHTVCDLIWLVFALYRLVWSPSFTVPFLAMDNHRRFDEIGCTLPRVTDIAYRCLAHWPLWPLLLTWFNFNSSMEKYLHVW